MTSVEEHRETARKAQEAIYKIEAAERKTQSAKLVGKTFKYRNCYSCHEKSSDYWWMYMRVTGVTEDGNVFCQEFQTDKYGDTNIRFKTRHYNHLSGYVPIPMSEYRRAFKAMQSKIAKAQP